MIFTAIPIAGAYLVDLEPRVDHRGSFSRAFCQREFAAHGIPFAVAQCNLAQTTHAGVVRGLHFCERPIVEQKLVRCVRGAVFDVLVDMRPDSSSRGMVYSTRLDSDRRAALFIPGGVAHGYQSLSDDTEFLYLTDHFYTPEVERGVRFDDPSLAIAWPLPPRDVAERDRRWPLVNWG